jgi:hypothetical protein
VACPVRLWLPVNDGAKRTFLEKVPEVDPMAQKATRITTDSARPIASTKPRSSFSGELDVLAGPAE